MGSTEDPSEAPVHMVRVKPFALGKYPVTVGEWSQCVAANACASSQDGNATAPARNLSWSDAQQYVTWLSKSTGQDYRLPSEAEWEYAARAGTTTSYWWGEKVDGKHVICRKCGSAGFSPATPPLAGSQPANPWGLVGMSGGVREWLADCWLKSYDKAPSDARPRVVKNCQQRVTRGGSWLDEPTELTVSSRSFYDAEVPYLANGFRVARDLE